jgi:hypothetical protein
MHQQQLKMDIGNKEANTKELHSQNTVIFFFKKKNKVLIIGSPE